MRRLLTASLLLAWAATAAAQTTTTFTDRLVLADPPAKSSETACLWRDASTGMVAAGACPTGTVTSVGLSMPGIFSVSGSPVTTSGTLTASLVSQGANQVWAAPNGSSGAPTFRSLVDADVPDNLTLGTVSGTPTFSGNTTISGTLAANGGVASHLIPSAADTYDLGSAAKPWNQGFLSQLNAVLFAEQTATLFGGHSIIGKNAGTFYAAVASGDSTINFGKAMTTGQWVVIRAHDTSGAVKAEYVQVGSLVSGTTYNVTRDLAGVHATDPAWAEGTPYLVLGQPGDGRIELRAYTTPQISVLTQGATYGAVSEKVRIGALDGMPGMASGKYGLYIGDTTGTQGLSYYDGALTVKGTVTATAGTIGGWTLGATSLTSGSGSTTVGLDSGGSNPALYAGSATPGSAPFRVTNEGALTATNATITGTVNFGGGVGVLDTTGAYVAMNTAALSFDTDNAYRLTAGDGGVSGVGGAYTTAGKYVWVRAENLSAGDFGRVRLEAKGKTDGGSVRTTYVEASAGYLDGSDLYGEYVDVSAGWLNGLSTGGTGYLRFNLGGAAGTVPSYLYSNDSEVNFHIGRNANEHLSIRVTDQGVILESVQDENSGDYGEMIYRADGDGTANGFHHFQKKDGSYASILAAGLNIRNWVAASGTPRVVCTEATTDGATGWLYYGVDGTQCVSSSARYKQNIDDARFDWARVLDLRPVTFEYTAAPGVPQFGLVAEEVEALGLEPLVVRTAAGMVEAVAYDRLALYLIPVLRQQQAQLSALAARLAALER